jgi:YesN/AraC family two-component response regulator
MLYFKVIVLSSFSYFNYVQNIAQTYIERYEPDTGR